LSSGATFLHRFNVEAVDPYSFPVVTPPTFTTPASGSLATLLGNDQAVVSQTFSTTYQKQVGDSIDLHAITPSHDRHEFQVKIVGIFLNSGLFAQAGSMLLVSTADFQAAAPKLALPYDIVDIATVDAAHTNIANSLIEGQFYYATTQTAANLLQNNQSQASLISKFLEIAGLLALLIGGLGIVNTMQVILSRRKTELAMLKTTGYRRRDLYLLFGVETGLPGLLGGVIGAVAAIGVSYIVRNLFQQSFHLNMPFLLDPVIISGGVLIGLCTSLIFGIMPAVQAASVRPLQVLRDVSERKRAGSMAVQIGLLLILSILFCCLASYLLQNVLWGIGMVYGTFLFLALLSVFCSLIIIIVSKLPVPERLHAVNMRIALRNIGRQRARMTTVMLALFVGVFTIGLILAVSDGLQSEVTTAITSNLSFNVAVITTGIETRTLQTHLGTLPGLTGSEQTIFASTSPLVINGVPVQQALPTGSAGQPSTTSMGNANAVEHLSTIEGYDVTNAHFSALHHLLITNGRSLNTSDLGTDNVLVGSHLVQEGPLHLRMGATITLASSDGKSTRTMTIVGAYDQGASDLNGDVVAPTAIALALSPANQIQTVSYLKINATMVSQALTTINTIVPDAVVYNISDLSSLVSQLLGNIVLMLTAIASLTMLAGILIVANSVALAMLERRRELGILKAVGYTSRMILSEVLIEHGIIGAAGAGLAMALVALATNLIGDFVFQILGFAGTIVLNGWLVLGLVTGIAGLSMVTAALVAFKPVRVRPLEVLRYE
jgi:ABC-type antimicrobial peptide transport system permease subunit